MLLHGLPPRKDESGADVPDGAPTPRHRAARWLGRAMELLLPAVDANDDDKLMAAVSFYTSVFSNCVALKGSESAALMDSDIAGLDRHSVDLGDEHSDQGRAAVDLGIDVKVFACEFLQRIFAAVDTLASGKEGAHMGDEEPCASLTLLIRLFWRAKC